MARGMGMGDRETSGRQRVAARDALGDGEMMRVTVDRRDVALYRIDGRLYATDDTCTHARASLTDGYLDGETVECPLHQACFHVPTGRVLAPPATEALTVYAVRVDDEGIWVGRPLRLGGAE